MYKNQFKGIERNDYVEKIMNTMDSGYVADIIGVRRSGKSTILNQIVYELLSKNIDPLNTLIVNFEDPRFNSINSIFEIYELYKEILKEKGLNNSKPYLFLDEIQKAKNWEGFVRSIIDRKEAFIAITGSNYNLSKGVINSLAGRHLSIEVFPLSFKEFLKFKGLVIRNKLDIVANEPLIKSYLKEYLVYGGFPSVVNNELKEQILTQMYKDIINNDVLNNCNVRSKERIEKLAIYYLSNIGNRVNFRRLTNYIQIPLRTLERLTNCIVNSFLINFVYALSPKMSIMIRSERKVYSIDNGLAYFAGHRLSENIGSLLENAVYVDLIRRYGKNSVFYYNGKNEVDFLIKIGNSVKEAYQVSYNLENERELNGLEELLKINNKITPFIITYDDNRKIKTKYGEINVVSAINFFLS